MNDPLKPFIATIKVEISAECVDDAKEQLEDIIGEIPQLDLEEIVEVKRKRGD